MRWLLVLALVSALVQSASAIHHTKPSRTVAALHPAPIAAYQPADVAIHEDVHCENALQAVAEGAQWRGVESQFKVKFLAEACADPRPTTCQTYSDVLLLSPATNGTATRYQSEAFIQLKCDTWPSFSIRANQNAGCHHADQVIKEGIKSAEAARRHCLAQIHPKCASYTWSNTSRAHTDVNGKDVQLPANTLAICSRKLHGYSTSPNTQVGHRLRSYLIRPDTSSRCDETQGKIVAGIMTNADARTLCDRQHNPPCVGYIWTGPIGVGRNLSATPTPFTVMMCAGFREYYPIDVPKSQYETAVAVGEYMIHPNSKGECSKWSQIATKWDVISSMQARLECDLYDGSNGAKCLSYVWNKRDGSVALCASVPQTSILARAADLETAWQRPESCQQISNRWFVSANETWGFATEELKQLYIGLECSTKPSSCDALSNFYGLHPKINWDRATRVPGSIRDLWLQQKCNTHPSAVARDRQKPAYQKIIGSIEAVEQRMAEVDDILRRASLSKSTANKKSMAGEVAVARKDLADTLRKLQKV